jgi:hypothetical protein
MALFVDLDPEVEERLNNAAHLLGLTPGKLAGTIVKWRMEHPDAPPQPLTIEDLRAMLEEIAEGSENLPKYPTSAFSRENIYQGCP